MGKRGRRKKQKGTFVERGPEALTKYPGAESLSEEFWRIESRAALKATIETIPEFSDPKYLRALVAAADGDTGFEPLMKIQADVLGLAGHDEEKAWATLEAFKAEIDRVGGEIEGLLEIAADLDVETLLSRIDALLPQVAATGMALNLGELHAMRGEALMTRQSENRRTDVEDAIAAMEFAHHYSPDPNVKLERAMQLGIAVGERLKGDRAENLEDAIRILRETAAAVTRDTRPETATLVQTNLATALLRRERGNRVQNLNEAREACHVALQHRSPERDAYDWAHTQLNLAEILGEIDVNAGRRSDSARAAYVRVLEEQEMIEEKWLVGAAYFGMGRLEKATATFSAQERVEAYDAGLSDEDLERGTSVALEAALEHFENARPLLQSAPDQIQHGRLLSELAGVNEDLGQPEQALEAGQAACAILLPTIAPMPCVAAAGRLGGLLADAKRWPEAAAAFGNALEASELLFQSRLETEDRQREAERVASLARWGAFAMAKAGDPLGAALALDSGRARELRRRAGPVEGDLEILPEVPAELIEAYRLAAARLVASPISVGADQAGRDFQEIVATIREASGSESFGAGASAEDLVRATADGWPLLYVNPTPYGTLLLMVESKGEKPVLTARCLEEPLALELFLYLMAGDAALEENLDEGSEPASYLVGVTGTGTSESLQAGLDEVIPWVGERIAAPLADLPSSECAGVTLVPCGPIALVPLHACSWPGEGSRQCLIDRLAVRYAPSAYLAGAAITRAAARAGRKPRLLAIANPDPPANLAAAESEVTEVSRHFDDARIHSAGGREATSAFLRRHADDATHIHLACHAKGSTFDLNETGVGLADGFLPATELTQFGTPSARLVTISACQSAMVEVSGGPEEVLSIGTASLAAGSACAIASLWPVEDLAAALLLTRTYELLFEEELSPPEALQQAARWLRDLAPSDEQRFLDAHPVLRAEFHRRTPEQVRHRRGGSEGAGAYSHPDFWAAFVAVGA